MERQVFCPGGCCRDLSELETDETVWTEGGVVMCWECYRSECSDHMCDSIHSGQAGAEGVDDHQFDRGL